MLIVSVIKVFSIIYSTGQLNCFIASFCRISNYQISNLHLHFLNFSGSPHMTTTNHTTSSMSQQTHIYVYKYAGTIIPLNTQDTSLQSGGIFNNRYLTCDATNVVIMYAILSHQNLLHLHL